MRILITNASLESFAGTQVVVKDLALELTRQGHEPIVYSPKLGEVAQEIERSGTLVTDQLCNVRVPPDVIHGHHHQTMEALLQFPSIPAVYVCHGAAGYDEAPFYFPRILRYVAVDERCRRRLAGVPGIPTDRTELIWNAVDLTRFRPRGPLPDKPKRALVFSNSASRSGYVGPISKACRQLGLHVDVAGLKSGNPLKSPESVLPRYDIVFAKARCALEALVVGNAVVLCDRMGLGPMVSTRNFDSLRPWNFGAGLLQNPFDNQLIKREIERYDANDASSVSERVRKEADLAYTVQRWVRLYGEVISEWSSLPRESNEEYRAMAAYIREWSYGARLKWESTQIRRLEAIPWIGASLSSVARRIHRKWLG